MIRPFATAAILSVLCCLPTLAAEAPNDTAKWDCADGKGSHVLWRADLGTHAGIAIVGEGMVLVGTNNEHPRDPQLVGDHGVLMAFAEDGGRFLWQVSSHRLPDRINDMPGERADAVPGITTQIGCFGYALQQINFPKLARHDEYSIRLTSHVSTLKPP